MDFRILSIINDYRYYRKLKPDTWLTHCKNQKSLYHAIWIAALSINNLQKRHPHQYKLKEDVLKNFAEALLLKEKSIEMAESFETIYNIVKNTGAVTFGVGEMLIYDTAERIGNYKGLFPQKIYLHAGTRKGAEILLGKIQSETITKNQLPEEFSSLTCSEIEDVLCMYKNKLTPVASNIKLT